MEMPSAIPQFSLNFRVRETTDGCSLPFLDTSICFLPQFSQKLIQTSNVYLLLNCVDIVSETQPANALFSFNYKDRNVTVQPIRYL